MTKAGESILRGAREALEYAKGERDGFIAHVPDDIDVRAIRKATKMSQAKFAATFGFSPAAIRNWDNVTGSRLALPHFATTVTLSQLRGQPGQIASLDRIGLQAEGRLRLNSSARQPAGCWSGGFP